MSQSIPVHRHMFCAVGFHTLPPRRDPPGPVVAVCPCCGKMMYCYGRGLAQRDMYPSLMIPDFPRVLGPTATLVRAY